MHPPTPPCNSRSQTRLALAGARPDERTTRVALASFWCKREGPSRGGTMEVLKTIISGKGPGTMIRDRYAPMNLFDLVPLAAHFEPELAQLDRLLDDDM